MHSPAFDVPEVMASAYDLLRHMGFRQITSTPAEWQHEDGDYLRFHHSGGEIEVIWRPDGKDSPINEQKWRWKHRENATSGDLAGWLGSILGLIRRDNEV